MKWCGFEEHRRDTIQIEERSSDCVEAPVYLGLDSGEL